jgi:hypothetical protein
MHTYMCTWFHVGGLAYAAGTDRCYAPAGLVPVYICQRFEDASTMVPVCCSTCTCTGCIMRACIVVANQYVLHSYFKHDYVYMYACGDFFSREMDVPKSVCACMHTFANGRQAFLLRGGSVSLTTQRCMHTHNHAYGRMTHHVSRCSSLWRRIKVAEGPEGTLEGGFVSVVASPLSTTLVGIPLCLRPDPSDIAAPPPLQDIISLLQVRVHTHTSVVAKPVTSSCPEIWLHPIVRCTEAKPALL